jgi:hypothetical protein
VQPLASTCATGVGLCHWSGLKYLSHGFQTQGTVATVVDLSATVSVDLCTWAMDFRPKVRNAST